MNFEEHSAYICSLSPEDTYEALMFFAQMVQEECPKKQYPKYPCEFGESCLKNLLCQREGACWLRYAVWRYRNIRREIEIEEKSHKAFRAKLKELRDEFGPEVVDGLIDEYTRRKHKGKDKKC
jgi:hypothetical protein